MKARAIERQCFFLVIITQRARYLSGLLLLQDNVCDESTLVFLVSLHDKHVSSSSKTLISQYITGFKNKEVGEREGGRKHISCRPHWKVLEPPQEALVISPKSHSSAGPVLDKHQLMIP